MAKDVVIVEALRTPLGSFQGAFSNVPAPKLSATLVQEILKRHPQIKPDNVDQFIMGSVLQGGVGQAPGRQACIHGGLSTSTPVQTINKVCGSGMMTIISGYQMIQSRDAEIVFAGGQENMTMAPYFLPQGRAGFRMGPTVCNDMMVYDGLWDPYNNMHMGMFAEKCAEKYEYSRETQDNFAKQSFERAIAATKNGWFKPEIVPVPVPQRKGDPIMVDEDEGPKGYNPDKMPALKPAFKKDGGTVTAANASSINDGSAMLVLMSREKAEALGFKIRARLTGYAFHAHEPEWFTTAPVHAMEKLYKKLGLKPEDIDLYEINEAFAVVTLRAMDVFNLSADKVNVHGGAVSLGHPIGCSGARIMVTLLHAMERLDKKVGMASICIGGGEALAMSIERE